LFCSGRLWYQPSAQHLVYVMYTKVVYCELSGYFFQNKTIVTVSKSQTKLLLMNTPKCNIIMNSVAGNRKHYLQVDFQLSQKVGFKQDSIVKHA